MAQRPGFLVSKVVGVDGGVSPNAYVPAVTVEIRVHYPPLQIGRVEQILADAYAEAMDELSRREETA